MSSLVTGFGCGLADNYSGYGPSLESGVGPDKLSLAPLTCLLPETGVALGLLPMGLVIYLERRAELILWLELVLMPRVPSGERLLADLVLELDFCSEPILA